MGELRIGVVGTGHLGNYHLQKYRKMPGVKIAAVADLIEEKASQVAQMYHCPYFTNYRDMIGRVDAVSIAVPTVCHYEITKDFLKAGVDVLLEKPIATSLEEAKELVKLAKEHDLILQIGLIERFNPAILALEKILDRPLFIEAHRLHPFFPRGIDVDVILDLMIHDLDIILKFVNSPLLDVAAVGVSVLSEKVDIANVRLSFSNGCVANVTASRVTAKTMQKIRFFGLSGYHAVDYAKREVVSLKRSSSGQIVPQEVKVTNHDPLEAEIASFIESVITRSPARVSGEDALPSLETACIINEKIRQAAELIL